MNDDAAERANRLLVRETHRQAVEELRSDPHYSVAPTSREVRAILRHHGIEMSLAEIVETCVAMGLPLADAPEPTRRLVPIRD